MSGPRFFDDRIHELIAHERAVRFTKTFISEVDGIYESEMLANKGRRSFTAIQAAGEKAADLLIYKQQVEK
jgi:hypothetical protein